MNKKLVTVVAVLSVLSLALLAFSPMTTVSAAYQDYRGPNNDPDDRPNGDALCDEDCEENLYLGSNASSNRMSAGTGFRSSATSSTSQRGSGFALAPLSEAEQAGLIRAIEEEYTARALYESMMVTFGDVEPFAEIAASEAIHAATLVRQAEKYGLEVPAYDPASYDFPTFATLDEAYQAGIDAEITDAALYDELMADVTHSDLARVYTNLQRASLNNHLVSFESYLND